MNRNKFYSNLLKNENERSYQLKRTYEKSGQLFNNYLKDIPHQKIHNHHGLEELATTKINKILLEPCIQDQSASFPIKFNRRIRTEDRESESIKRSKGGGSQQMWQKKIRFKTQSTDNYKPIKMLFKPQKKSNTFGLEQINCELQPSKKAPINNNQSNLSALRNNLDMLSNLNSSNGFKGSFYSTKAKLKTFSCQTNNNKVNKRKEKEGEAFGPNIRQIYPKLSIKNRHERLRIRKQSTKAKIDHNYDIFRRTKTDQIPRSDFTAQLCAWKFNQEEDIDNIEDAGNIDTLQKLCQDFRQ